MQLGFSSIEDYSYQDDFFRNLVKVYKEKSLYQAKSFYNWLYYIYFSLFPSSDNYEELINKIDNLLNSIPKELIYLERQLKESKDHIQRKMKTE